MAMFQRSSRMAMGLLLGGGVLTPVGAAQLMYEAPLRLIHDEGAVQMADASSNWAIRPAEGANPRMQSTDAPARPNVPPSDARSSEIKTEDGIRYVSGGIGESERSELQALSSQFNLHLMFATQGSGEYLSAVRVSILDTHQAPVLTATSKGPWFYAQLPPGDYRVDVTPTGERGEGQTQRKAVHLAGSSPAKMDFYWEK